MKLTDREWKEFFIGGKEGIFDLCASFSGIDKNKLLDGDVSNIPYITRSDVNNGISLFVGEKQSHKYKMNKGNIITIGLDTQTVFYQPHLFYTGQNIQVLSNRYLNQYNALFIVRLLKTQLRKFSWGGNGATLGRLARTKILLPSNNNFPDYQFMEDYIKEIMHRKRQEYIDYAKVKLEQNRTEQIISLHSKKWKEFFVVDIFSSIQRGKRLIKDKQVSGNVPYVSSTAMNNGVDNFIQYDSSKMRKYQNCLSVANSGSVGASFYEPFEYVASDHVTHLKNDNFNRNIYLFIAAMTNRWSQKYNFNREINDPRISREKILLPVNNKDEPDFAYMEQYVNNILMQKYNDYLEYAKKSQNIWNT